VQVTQAGLLLPKAIVEVMAQLPQVMATLVVMAAQLRQILFLELLLFMLPEAGAERTKALLEEELQVLVEPVLVIVLKLLLYKLYKTQVLAVVELIMITILVVLVGMVQMELLLFVTLFRGSNGTV
jgi:hypothetical protein